jgi:hypothetical protein
MHFNTKNIWLNLFVLFFILFSGALEILCQPDKILHSKGLKEYFITINSKEQRNERIVSAYLDRYTQVELDTYLNLSKSIISKVVKSGDSTFGCSYSNNLFIMEK